MRWLRDNWIDALIFAVFAVTVVGIVLFLTGVNPFKARTPAPAPAPQMEQPRPQTPAAQPEAPPQPEETVPVTVVPLLPEAPEPQAPAEPVRPEPAQPATPAQPSTPAAPAPAQPAENPTGIFRVSVGAFGNPLNALALAEQLEARGYPVRLEPVGRVTRVVVGPYNNRAEAERAAAQLAKYEPQVYRGDTPPPAGRYLQVGAFKRLDSARAVVAKLREEGDWPVVLNYRRPWLKVWVGPVDDAEMAGWKARLEALGFEVVEVR
ncbi:SPOR domain-containing protein [Oceanithermus sp.]